MTAYDWKNGNPFAVLAADTTEFDSDDDDEDDDSISPPPPSPQSGYRVYFPFDKMTGSCDRCCRNLKRTPLNECPNYLAYGMDCLGNNSRLGYCLCCSSVIHHGGICPLQNCPTYRKTGHGCV